MPYALVGGPMGSKFLWNAVSDDGDGNYSVVCSAHGPMSAFFMAEAVAGLNNREKGRLDMPSIISVMSRHLEVTAEGKVIKRLTEDEDSTITEE